MTADPPLLVTHDGKFHCDEVFAYAVLRLALGLDADGDHVLVRTRDPALIDRGAIVWDVGTRHDPAARRFDHHQRGAPRRADGTPFSAAGLVWQVYGTAAVGAALGGNGTGLVAEIASSLDETVVCTIDRIDNGLLAGSDPLGLPAIVDDLNPSWDADRSPGFVDGLFLQASALARGVLCRRVEATRARLAARAGVIAALDDATDRRILVLDRPMPWKTTVHERTDAVLLCVSPGSNGHWTVYAMPTAPGLMDQRCPLPAAWAGLEGEALVAASGVADAVFVHLRRFMGAARSREGAMAMARGALAAMPSEMIRS